VVVVRDFPVSFVDAKKTVIEKGQGSTAEEIMRVNRERSESVRDLGMLLMIG